MPLRRIHIDGYSKFYDHATGAEFHPVLDRRTGVYRGVAEVSDEVAGELLERPAFSEISENVFDAMEHVEQAEVVPVDEPLGPVEPDQTFPPPAPSEKGASAETPAPVAETKAKPAAAASPAGDAPPPPPPGA
jgi:hypothetical protein